MAIVDNVFWLVGCYTVGKWVTQIVSSIWRLRGQKTISDVERPA